ncbi:energy-coupling factor transporter transmembrane component T [Lentilactobacillus otakiensis]|jgi:energy-coupling factor transport system permease protein|uniref:Cobalt ABC transporter permease CbiQ n=1 Tax=Lentilactobacillus otakiensis DSM 19908 = JCM 15040 TaxID=1423780 RepID=S4NBV0_9LACO|nr:energy-coupling factor transporter transmembrane component T [Lentilactobacillus otakiensis]KRL10383.1 ABC transporter [Lentilactobacillus otakiensis DSM 19908 = JCM 15040]MBZ3777052.1 energy-coupling factor transporter transmembrane protein EcfT [Lentilactobacillus otakiensis]MDV3518075.1 energy-coupling factor transporter transmembrane component T [Lentilactobacillus otakiensis]GAD16194.1 cobalt ABC transporter permease CbiQ [Lentilactobacillus otakiensis DSM 19908 = JCM 15040]
MNKFPIRMTFFYQLHPAAAAVYFLEVIIALLLFNHVAVAIAGLVGLTMTSLMYLGKSTVWRQFKMNLILFITIVLFNCLLNQRFGPILWQLPLGSLTFKLTLPALTYGIVMGLMLVEMLMIFNLLNAILPANKLVYVFSPVAPKLGLLVVISTNLVKAFVRNFHQLSMLQKTRNVDLAVGSVSVRVKNGGRLLQILLEDSLASGMETARLMDARGFGAAKRTHYHTYRWQGTDWLYLLWAGAIFTGIVAARVNQIGWSGSVRQFTAFWQGGDILVVGLLSLLLILPLLAEGVYRLCTN